MLSLYDIVSAARYPGRGIIVGLSADSARAMYFYFIMGRSDISRNRVFAPDGEGVRILKRDTSLRGDESLTIYSPVRVLGAHTIITNGDQTDTIYSALSANAERYATSAFARALETREFEPDAPNYTPRISALATIENGALSFAISILKCADGDINECRRFTFTYPRPRPGAALFISTYSGEGDPLKSFEGEPKRAQLLSDIDGAARDIWSGLDADNKVALFARCIHIASGKTRTLIYNKYGEDADYGERN